MMAQPPLIIAIDGPAASGKGTLARQLADAFDLPHLDTGLTFRAVAAQLMAQKAPLDDEMLAIDLARQLDLSNLDRETLSRHEIGTVASKIAVMPKLRSELVSLQRGFAEKGAVLDGRDIGTVVCPNAAVKLFVTASAQARAERRHLEALSKGSSSSFEQILTDIEERDERDRTRKVAPMQKAADAHLIDTTKMDIETAFKVAKNLVLQARAP